MKKFNGTDYDGLLPLAYNALNSQQLDGKTFNEIQNLFTTQSNEKYPIIYRVARIGTGTATSSSPAFVTFEQPVNWMFVYNNFTLHSLIDFVTETISSSNYSFVNNGTTSFAFKRSQDNKTFYFYSSLDALNELYVFYGISGAMLGDKPYIYIEASSTFIVPYTRKYYIELYGGGGGGYHENTDSSYYGGGSSCQSYNNVQLIKGQKISVTIGSGGSDGYFSTAKSGGKTIFGTYSVNGGGAAKSSAGGAAAGNLGTKGGSGRNVISYSNRKLAPLKYRWGKAGMAGENGAVVLKYLRT